MVVDWHMTGIIFGIICSISNKTLGGGSLSDK